jgi:hypothetical protein
MKKTLIFAIIGVLLFICLACCCCISLIVGLGAYASNKEVSYFKDNRAEFNSIKEKYEDDLCFRNVISSVEIGKKDFSIYFDCDLGTMAFETSAIGGGRVDYVHAKDIETAMKVDECSDENGRYSKSLGDNWYLCYGDWN